MMLIRSKFWRMLFGVLENANFLFLRLLLLNRKRAKLFPGRTYRNFVELAGRDHWPSKDIREVVSIPGETSITLHHLSGEGIETDIEELAYLALITEATKPKVVFEIGTFRGRTALNFAANSPADCIIWTLDLPPDAHLQKGLLADDDVRLVKKATADSSDFQNHVEATKIRRLFGNSIEFDFSPYYGSADIVFVDGGHSYRVVSSDTKEALKMVRPGGLIVWHDFAVYGDYNDVTRAVLDLMPRDSVCQIGHTTLAIYHHLSNGSHPT
jgi:predicted O-methyltransferase YrrM